MPRARSGSGAPGSTSSDPWEPVQPPPQLGRLAKSILLLVWLGGLDANWEGKEVGCWPTSPLEVWSPVVWRCFPAKGGLKTGAVPLGEKADRGRHSPPPTHAQRHPALELEENLQALKAIPHQKHSSINTCPKRSPKFAHEPSIPKGT